MGKSTQKPETRRFIEVFNLLIKQGIVNSALEFATSIDYLNTSFSSVLNGRRDIPISAINNTCKKYGINRDYLFDGMEPIFTKDLQTNVVAEPRAEYGNTELLKLTIKHQQEKIAMLEGEIIFLKEMLNPNISKRTPVKKK